MFKALRDKFQENGIAFSWLRSWHIELLALVFILTCWSPYRNANPLIAGVLRNPAGTYINSALGLLKRGIYPCQSPEFPDFLTEAATWPPEQLLNLDLNARLRTHLWPPFRQVFLFNVSADAGMPYFIYYLWKLSGTNTLQTVVNGLEVVHCIGILAFFGLAVLLNIRGLALLCGLGFAYSSAAIQIIFACENYLFLPVIMAVATFLCALVSLPRGQRLPVWVRYATVALIGALLAVGGFARSTIYYAWIPLVVLLCFSSVRLKSKNNLALAIILLFSFCTVKTIVYRTFWTPEKLELNQRSSHSLWHSIWGGLGEFENPYGFGWYDVPAYNYAKTIDPSAQVGSDRYEKILKSDALSTIRKHPIWYASVLLRRMKHLAFHWGEFLPESVGGNPVFSIIGFILAGIGYGVSFKDRKRPTAFLFITPFLFYGLVPILVYSSSFRYNVTFYMGLYFSLLYLLLRSCELIKAQGSSSR